MCIKLLCKTHPYWLSIFTEEKRQLDSKRGLIMRKWKFLYYLCGLAMIAALINVFLNGDFALEASALLTNNWAIMSLVDLFAGIFIFSSWIVFREKNIVVILLLLISMLFFGFLTASLYILYNLYKSKKDMTLFFLGEKNKSSKTKTAGR